MSEAHKKAAAKRKIENEFKKKRHEYHMRMAAILERDEEYQIIQSQIDGVAEKYSKKILELAEAFSAAEKSYEDYRTKVWSEQWPLEALLGQRKKEISIALKNEMGIQDEDGKEK